MQFLLNYLSFFLNTVTIVVAAVVVLLTIFSLAAKNKLASKNQIVITKLNQHYEKFKTLLNKEILSKKEFAKFEKSLKSADKNNADRKRIFVLHFNGDMKASQVAALREEITAILTVATPHDEVVLCLESPGGMVHGYGLAASQLQRLRARNISLTIAVDKVAASGGYMMACVGNKIIAAPFAIIGSIGVVMQLPNFHKLLEKNDIEFEQLTAGEYKRTLTMFGKNTEKGRAKMQAEIEGTQVLFKDFIQQNRAIVPIDQVATGEYWFAINAIKYKLVDAIQTSDDYLLTASATADIYEVKKATKKTLLQKLGHAAHAGYDGVMNKMWREQQENRY
jgi:serine protease SohB